MPTIWKNAPKSGAQRVAEYVARHNRVSRAKCADQERRDRLEADTQAWLLWYFPDVYVLPFGTPHSQIIKSAEYAIEHGTSTAVAAPRSTGKTTVLWGVNIKAVATGKKTFPVQLPWEAKGVKQALRFWKNALCFNERFAADYPELCNPFVASKGSAQKLMALTWEDNGNNTGARLQLSEGKIILPDSRGILGSTTINGNPRGMNHSTEDGRVLRPDVVMIDDPQSREAAKSAAQVKEIIATIDSDVMGLGGAGKRMSALMACTVTCKNDVAEHYLTAPEWDAVRIKRITEWPVGWGDDNSVAQKLWNEWAEIRLRGLEEKDGNAAAVAFYQAHKLEMTEGMTVSWGNRFDSGQPDALYSAIWDYYRLGPEGFASEHQNEPIEEVASAYALSTDLILSHVSELPPLALPSLTTRIVGHIDVNKNDGGLHWTVCGFDQAMTGHVPMYGHFPDRGDLYPTNSNDQVIRQSIFAGLRSVCDRISQMAFMLNGKPTQPQLILVDVSFQSETIHRFCDWAKQSRLYLFQVIPAMGRDAKNYRYKKENLIGKPWEGGHIQKSWNNPSKQYLMFNADQWRETMQRAFLSSPGAAGGMTVFKANKAAHVQWAEQIRAEHLRYKVETPAGWRWEWAHAPGTHWDYGDNLTGCWVAAAALGLTVGGFRVPTQQKYVEARKCRVAREA